MESVKIVALVLLLVTASITDLWKQKIPNWLTVTGVCSGVCVSVWVQQWLGALQAVQGMLVGGGVLLLVYWFGALGAGDVKLFAAIGAITGPGFVWDSLLYSLIYAGIIGLALLAYYKQLLIRGVMIVLWLFRIILEKEWNWMKKLDRKQLMTFPFMYAVIPGVITAYYWT